MGKVAFVGKSNLSSLFKVLGFDVITPQEEPKNQTHLDEYEIIFTQAFSDYKKLKESHPYKIIVPLVDLEERKVFIKEGIENFIRSTVGGAPLEE